VLPTTRFRNKKKKYERTFIPSAAHCCSISADGFWSDVAGALVAQHLHNVLQLLLLLL
jgi:hypothetical protein